MSIAVIYHLQSTCNLALIQILISVERLLAFNIFIYTNKELFELYRQASNVTVAADVCEYSYTGSH